MVRRLIAVLVLAVTGSCWNLAVSPAADAAWTTLSVSAPTVAVRTFPAAGGDPIWTLEKDDQVRVVCQTVGRQAERPGPDATYSPVWALVVWDADDGVWTPEYGIYGAYVHASYLSGTSRADGMLVGIPGCRSSFADTRVESSQDLTRVAAGSVFEVSVGVHATGSIPVGQCDDLGEVRLGTVSPTDHASPYAWGWLAPNRPAAPRGYSCTAPNFMSGSEYWATFSMRAPSTPGTYVETLGLVAEGQTWLDGPTIRIAFTVPAPPAVLATNNSGEMSVRLRDFPLGKAYYFCHTGSPESYPRGGDIAQRGSFTVTSADQTWATGVCSGSGSFWIGIQGADRRDYYGPVVLLSRSGPPEVRVRDAAGRMDVTVANFPLGRAYYFCHAGSAAEHPLGGTVRTRGVVDVVSSDQQWSGLCAGTGEYWLGIQAPDGRDYYSSVVTLTAPAPVVEVTNGRGDMRVHLTNFPTGLSYWFCHRGSTADFPYGGDIVSRGSFLVSAADQSFAAGICAGVGNHWLGIQATNGRDYYSNQIVLGDITPPDAPHGVTARAGDTSAVVSWSPPESDGGAPVLRYDVVAEPGGAGCTAVSGRSCEVLGLSDGYAYVFTVTAWNAAGTSAASQPSATVVPAGRPAAPTGVTASPEESSAVIRWTAPDPRGSAVLDYEVTGTDDVGTPTAPLRCAAPAVSCRVPALGPGRGYSFTVTARNDLGVSDPSAASARVSPVAPFVAVTPVRIADTASGTGVRRGSLGAGEVLDVPVAGVGGIPASGVAAVVVSLTAASTSVGRVTVYPTGQSQPGVTSVSLSARHAVTSSAVVPVGSRGRISLVTSTDTQVSVDVTGWFPIGARFTPVPGVRIVDSAGEEGEPASALGPWETLDVPVAGAGGVPPAGVEAVAVSVTAASASGGSLTVYPTGRPRPRVPSVTFAGEGPVTTMLWVAVGADGRIRLSNGPGSTSVAVDVLGWFPKGVRFSAIPATEVAGGHSNLSVPSLSAGTVVDVAVSGLRWVPRRAAAVVLSVSAMSTDDGRLTVFPTGEATPLTTSVSLAAGRRVTTTVVVKVGRGGRVSVRNATGSTQVAVTVTGWFPAL